MGITLSRKREAAAESIARMAAIPREEMARFIDRCWAASCDEGKRISGVGFTLRKRGCLDERGIYQVEPRRFRRTSPSLRGKWRPDSPRGQHLLRRVFWS